jgi:hypothetical protein
MPDSIWIISYRGIHFFVFAFKDPVEITEISGIPNNNGNYRLISTNFVELTNLGK